MTVTRDQMWRAVRRLRPEMTRAEFDGARRAHLYEACRAGAPAVSGPPFAMSKYASEADLLRDKCEWLTGLLRQIVAGWHQSGTAEVWAADALKQAADYIERQRGGASPADPRLDYEVMASAFSAWISSRPAGYEGDEPVNPGNRWFDAFAAGAHWCHVACTKQEGGNG